MKNSYWVVLAVIVLGILFGKILFANLFNNSEQQISSIPSKHIAELKSQNVSYEDLQKVLSDTSIFLWGSSELSSPGEVCPLNLMPNCFNKHILAMGHAGAQSFAALGFFATHYDLIKSKKIVLFVSPNWFCGDAGTIGTHPALFSQYFDYDNYNNLQIDGSAKTAIGQYFTKHKEDLNAEFPISNKFEDDSAINYSSFFRRKASLIKQYFLTPAKKTALNPIQAIDFHKREIRNYQLFFDSLKTISQVSFLSTCTNNNYGIYDDYYTKYCDGKLPFSLIPTQLSENQELKDLKTLLQFLKTEDYNPLVVLLPVNPYAYDMKDFLPFEHHIEDEITKYNFPFLNLFVNDTTTYQMGMCRDAMHTGPLGWIEINKKILETFYSNEYGN